MAIRPSLPLVLGGLLAVFLIGALAFSCAVGPRFNYQGVWEGHRKINRPDLEPGMAYTAGWVTLIVRDGKYEMTSAGVPTNGSLEYEGNHLILHTEGAMNVPLDRSGSNANKIYPDVKVIPRPDGTLLLEDPNAIDGKPLLLTRKAVKKT